MTKNIFFKLIFRQNEKSTKRYLSVLPKRWLKKDRVADPKSMQHRHYGRDIITFLVNKNYTE